MVNIFDTLPRNFFNIFNTADRVVISECICVLYEYIKDDASFASLKENLIYELTKYFSSHLIELEELQSQSPRERAFYVYRRLKECGWLSEEVGENYHVWFIVFIRSLKILILKMDIRFLMHNIV